jgi:hypothetical protein
VTMLVLGVISAVAIYLTRTKSKHAFTTSRIVLLLAAFCLAVVGRAAYLGGQIRHTEIGGAVVKEIQGESEEQD